MMNLQEAEANLIDLLASVSPGTVSAQSIAIALSFIGQARKSLAHSDREAGTQS
jgi:hypothetical protein